MHFLQLLTDYCRVSWNFKRMRFKLHKFNVAILDTVTFTGDCSPIDNSGPKESVGRAKLPVLMILLSVSYGSGVVQITERWQRPDRRGTVKNSVSISLAFMGRDEPVD